MDEETIREQCLSTFHSGLVVDALKINDMLMRNMLIPLINITDEE